MTEPTPAYTPAPVAQKTNVLAIVSLVISILGFNIIAIILGAIALNQIKKSGESGRGLALAGVIIGAVSLVIGIVIIIVSIAVVAANTTITTY